MGLAVNGLSVLRYFLLYFENEGNINEDRGLEMVWSDRRISVALRILLLRQSSVGIGRKSDKQGDISFYNLIEYFNSPIVIKISLY